MNANKLNYFFRINLVNALDFIPIPIQKSKEN